MDHPQLARIDMNLQPQVRNPARKRTTIKVAMRGAAFIAIIAAGFLLGGAAGAATVVLCWIAALIVRWRLWAINARNLAEPVAEPRLSPYANIEDVNDILEDIARRRNWDLDKRWDIARMACENRTTTFDELERRYDRGVRSEFSRRQQDSTQHPKSD
jgi:hypothetical protein